MLKFTVLWISLSFVFIFNGSKENSFLVLCTILVLSIFKDIKLKKIKFKNIIYSVFISYLCVNIFIVGILKDRVDKTDILIESESDKTAVILIYDGESEKYNVNEKANEIYESRGYKSYLDIIFRLSKTKDHYDKIGSSDFIEDSDEISKKLSSKLSSNYTVVNSYMYTAPYVENTISNVVSSGYKEIILCPMFVSEGVDYENLKKRVNSLDIERFDLDIQMTDVFYKSNILAKSYKDEIIKNIKDENEEIGILLIGLHEKNKIEQDILLREKIKEYILSEKSEGIEIKLPLLENNKNDIIESGEDVLEYGIDSLFVVIPTTIVENINIKYDVETILKKLNISETKIHYIEPLSKSDAIVEEIYTKISLIN